MPDYLTRRPSERTPQQSVRVEPVADTENPGDEVEQKNLAPLGVAWTTAVLPLLGVLAAQVFYRAGYRRVAFQSLVLGLWGFMPLVLGTRAHGDITLLGLLVLMPLALIYFLRRLDWPVNAPAVPTLTPHQPFSLNTYVRARLVWFGYAAALMVAFAFLIWSHPSLLNLLLILLGIPTLLAPIGLVTMAIMLLRRATGWRPKVKWVDRHLIVFAAFLTCILVLLIGTDHAEQVARHHMTVLVPVLERYHADRGTYPEKLTALVPSYLDEKPQCFGNGGSDVKYFRHDNDGYNLACFIFVFLRVSYDSDTYKWDVYD